MDVFESIILGLIQGLAEFLPISSSGHLIILPWFFGWGKHPLIFDIILHAGTLLAIVIYFRRDWIDMLRFKSPSGKRLFRYIIIASLPAIVFGAVMVERVEHYFRNPIPVAFTLGIFGLALYFSEIYGRKNKSLGELTLMIALSIGLFQMLAIIPGVSRSGITISAALILGLRRESSVRFSFLLGAPIVFAAVCYGMGKLVLGGFDAGGVLSWPEVLGGFITALLSSMIAIHFLLGYVKKYSFNIFAVYRIVLSLFILVILFWN